MLTCFVFALLSIHPYIGPDFDARIKQLSLDRGEATGLCACLNGKFTYYSEVGLGDPQFSVVYFPAGRADRMILSSTEVYGRTDKGFAASYEICNGRARRLWSLDCPLTLKGGRFTVTQPVKPGKLALKADLARPWVLACYPSPDLMGNAPREFEGERGAHSQETFNTAEPYPVTAAEKEWLRKNGFPKADNVREPANEMRRWDTLADQLQKGRQQLAIACSKPTDKILPDYYFPIGRSDSIIVVRSIRGPLCEVSSYRWEKGKAQLRWHFLFRETEPDEEKYRGLILGQPSPKTVSKEIRRVLEAPSGFVEYIGLTYIGRIFGASGEIADYGQSETARPFETKRDEILYLRANRPWPGSARTPSIRQEKF